MGKSLALTLGTLGVGGAGIGAAGAHLLKKTPEAPKVTFRDKYSKALLSDDINDAIWTTKLTALSDSASNPKHPDLVKAKSDKKQGNKEKEAKDALKKGCYEIYSRSVEGQDDFSDFKNFCSLNNGDKIDSGKVLVDADGDFTSHWSTFNAANRDSLYKGFREAYDSKGSSESEGQWKSKMLQKCKEIAKDIFDDPISDFNTYCTKTKNANAGATTSGSRP
ncbi:hypothetical protein MHF_1063 [Mycoplasma haemofelis Ohio2]|uniref:Uncharacterized protein n=1 Tax=Mycoplasma haemofelis (strain Ohio2) TaxID=859194 RepID=F6FJF8_MYCHI|nr:hypothetical protein MHF_1063 [Mycoplasma haemofelis Ohio2]